ncbi:MAG: aa3-type cytochrome oxidase subunit IV [Actinomycetota bacterium]
MKTEVKLFAFSGFFSLLVAAVYWLLSYERAGSVLLLFMFLAPLFVGGYLAYRGGRLRRAEDEPDADHSSHAGEPIGHFHSTSLWPFLMGLGVALFLEGFVFGLWLALVGVVLFALAGLGLMRESRN